MVTVGMNYKVIPGKEVEFETVFDKVLTVMAELDGHEETHLFRAVTDPQSYLVISQWETETAFRAFTGSDKFASVTAWGKSKILQTTPKHEVYGGTSDQAATGAGQCPVPH